MPVTTLFLTAAGSFVLSVEMFGLKAPILCRRMDGAVLRQVTGVGVFVGEFPNDRS